MEMIENDYALPIVVNSLIFQQAGLVSVVPVLASLSSWLSEQSSSPTS